jgi:IclR family transcriptional regulator, acetate operon repressor
VPSYTSALCLVHDHGQQSAACRPHLRELVPSHCTATGKALLAWRDQWREAVLTQPLERFTERTNVGPESLRKELARTQARGYSVEDREYQPDTRGLAAPVFSHTGETVAALGVVAPMARLPANHYSEIGAAIMRHARALSEDLGFSKADAGATESARAA